MNKRKIRFRTVLTAVGILFFGMLLAISSSADYGTVAADGTCGDDLTWILYADGLLEISGKGDMWDYDTAVDPETGSITTTAPWGEYISSVTRLGICEGVTGIGYASFCGCKALAGGLLLPASLTRIGGHAFYKCGGIAGDLILPKNVDEIGAYAFWGCSSLKSVYFRGNAPSEFGIPVFDARAEGFSLCFLDGTDGWTTPEWNGYPCCPMDEIPEIEIVAVAGVSLDHTTAVLTVGDTLTLTATVIPADATDKSVTWETSDPAIATVDNGVVTAVSEGAATVTVTTKDGGFKAECIVTVKAAPVPGEYERGNVNGDGKLDSNDAIYLLRHTMNPSRYPIVQSGDMNGNGKVDSNDAIYLLRHTMNPKRYPIK